MYFILLLIIETVDFYPVPSLPSRVCVCDRGCVSVRDRQKTADTAALWGNFKPLFSWYTKGRLCVCPHPAAAPTSRQSRWHNCIRGAEIQGLQFKRRMRRRGRGRRSKKAGARMKRAGKEPQTGSFTLATGTQRLRHCDKRQSKCICKCKRLLSLLKHCAGFFPVSET